MINLDEAAGKVLAACRTLPAEEVGLAGILGRPGLEDIHAGEDVPPFPRSMMDGFAVRHADVASVPARLEIAGEVCAGGFSPVGLAPGQAFRIMTGAPLPDGADAVQMKERCRENGGTVEILEPVEAWKNVARKGSECARGCCVIEKGVPLESVHAGILATLGIGTVRMARRPAIRMINTGSELVDVAESLSGGKIRNSNRHTLGSLLRAEGFPAEWGGVAKDTPEAIQDALNAAGDCDVVLLTGGVSVGDYDLVAASVTALGWEVVFDAVAIKPGKPVVFARKGDRLLFGLSGNPVSSMLQCILLVLPALRRLSGWSRPAPAAFPARLATPARHNPGRRSLKPGRFFLSREGAAVDPVREQGSADLFAWGGADCFFEIPADLAHLDRGTFVQVVRLPGFAAWPRGLSQ